MNSHGIARRQLRAFGAEAILFQQAPGYRNEHGVYVQGDYTARRVTVVAQPPTEAIVARVTQEGTRAAGSMTFYMLPTSNVEPLRTGDAPTGRDLIQFDGVYYRVQSVEPWGAYIMAYAVRLDEQKELPELKASILSGSDTVLSGGLPVTN